MDYVRANPFEDAVKNYPEFPEVPDRCYTVLADGKIAGIFGLFIMWEGVGELWLMLTKDYMDFGVSGFKIYKIIEDRINRMISENNIVRA
ncbi:unnamed protein product, partial [marine sediment metagenome]